MSILVGVRKAEYSNLLEHTKTTRGNLSFQLGRLGEAGYIDILKTTRGSYPLTTCEISPKVIDAYVAYVIVISEDFTRYLKPEEPMDN